MTIILDVIAVCRAPDDDVPSEVPAPAKAEPELPVVPASSGVYLIHVAPSARLDPSAADLDSVEIVDGETEPAEQPIKKFLID